jgi:hypothetical protein
MGGPIFNRPVEGVDDGNKHYGVRGRSNREEEGDGVRGISNSRYGVFGKSTDNVGVYGESNGGHGVRGISNNNVGVSGYSPSGWGVIGYSPSGIGMWGVSSSSYGVLGGSTTYIGVRGASNSGDGVVGDSFSGTGVFGASNSSSGVYGLSNYGDGVRGISFFGGDGVRGSSFGGYGVSGYSSSNVGVYGETYSGDGVFGLGNSSFGIGVHGRTDIGGIAVFGESNSGFGVYGFSNSGYAVYCHSGPLGFAAYLNGRTHIHGPLTKPGGAFKIDHPLDPANKYLSHSFVESPDMKNVYDGVVVLDNKGEAEIELPDWFGALNKDFRYQLTAIGAPGPNLYIAKEISDAVTNYSNSSSSNKNSRFKIAGGTSGMKVSWQVTGIRKDPWANAHRIQVEEDKPAKELGYYMYPDLYGKAAEKGITHLLFPTEEKERKKQQLLVSE